MKIMPFFKTNRALFLQFLLVFVAFSIMVFLGGYFGSGIVNKYIANYGDEVINASAETIKTYLQGHEITLNDFAFIIEEQWAKSRDIDAIRAEFTLWSDWLHNTDQRFNDFLFLYGVVDGTFVDCSNWDYPEDYKPETRIWYTGATAQGGKVFYSDPYVDAHTGQYVMTISKMVFMQDKKPFGVIALDVLLSSISDYIKKMQLIDSGYGVLMDSNRRIITHPMESVFGVQLESLAEGSGYKEIAELLKAGEDISAFNFTSIMGGENVGFFKKLFNGWYIELSLPSNVYYSDIGIMQIILSVTGFILALLFCGILTFMHIAKNRSDTANKVKSTFLANMSHEIRTPMNAIIGMTELLLHEQFNERQRSYVNDINISARSLLGIINDILDLSKIESGKLTLSPINYDFSALIDNINSMFQYVAQKKEIEFRLESVGNMPKVLFGDDIRLRQVLTNLCGNAIKFTEKGYVRLKVAILDDMLMFEIKDTGIGIHKEAMPKLFNAFVQATAEKNRSIVGTGLGLTISKAFVEMMGGKIMMSSEYGQGTIVTVMIPIVLGNELGVKHEDKSIEKLTIYAPDARILLVDDNEFNLKVAYGLFKLFGIDAKTVFSGKEAIDFVQENDFDIVFMDHMMPEMDGVEATAEIRKLGGKYKNIPIIALTANAVNGAKEMFLANGFNSYISKPIDMQTLSQILKEWLPQEKILKSADPDEPADAVKIIHGDFWKTIDNIEEINTEIGLSRVSGIVNMYCDNLQLFHKKLLTECKRLSAYIRDEDIGSFSIAVHAMKSALSTIGAMKLSDAAYKLETASKNKDLAYCVERFPGFREALMSLHGKLLLVFPDETVASVKQPGEPAFLQENIRKALAAADEYDNDTGMKAVNQLLAYDFGAQNNVLLENASTAFEKYDFDGAKDTLMIINLR